MGVNENIFTACIRRMGEGNIFSLFTLAGRRGYPVPCLRVGGGNPSQVWVGVPCIRFGWWMVPHPRSGWGVPHPKSGQGPPHPRSEWGYYGYPLARSGWWGVLRYPHDWMGYPPP